MIWPTDDWPDSMRTLLLALCLLLSACGGEPETAAVAPAVSANAPPAPEAAAAVAPATVGAPGVEQSRRLLDAYLAAMNRHDADQAASLLAEDVVMFDALLGSLSHGRAEARDKVISMYLRAVPDGQWTLRNEPVVSASGFSYEWTLTGVNIGDWASYLRGRGQKINFKGISTVRVKNGKIVYQANYFDTQALGQQAGW
jgi:steroid delta-isomerase-like uncharacterized protein